ncbi:ABC transporter permease subunit [Alicyclobacillus sp. SO9]|uniref:ABC transporter permease subunit n=1 Tax=Alicyclobacillus sp. SO9 TaxID=2665646 RepID=UPI0018E827AB|nr:ABC transporter permease subunit [Alicyclobacillus sp. SO9]QQE77401.1 ABC transporter permease [Alicyclobacillus sp. SO9]
MGEIWRVSLNEWMKLVRRKRLWVAAALAILLVALFAYGTYRQQVDKQKYQTPSYTAQQITNTKNTIKAIKNQPQTAQTKQNLQQQQSELTSLQNEYKLQKAEAAGNWKPAVNKQIQSAKAQIKSASGGSSSPTGQSLLQLQQSKLTLMSLQYEVNHNIKPILPWQSSPYQSLKSFMTVATAIFLPLMVVILTADMVSGEATSGTIKLLLVRPVSRTKILIGKWLVSLFASAVLTFLTMLALLGAGIAVLGNKGALLPQVVGVYYKFIHVSNHHGPGFQVGAPMLDHASVLPAWQYTLLSILLVTFAMLSITTVTFLLSTLFKSSMASTAVALGIVILGNIAIELIHAHWMVAWFPVHFNLGADWTGSTSTQMKMNVGLATGTLILLAWIVVSIVASIIKFKRQDVLNA